MERQLRLRKKFTEDETRFYISEIIIALGALHKMQIISRDLKPTNLVLDAEGHICLTNFGRSKQGLIDDDDIKKSFYWYIY